MLGRRSCRWPDGTPYPSGVIPERLRPILADVRPLAQRFDAAGQRLYLVGGIVRDAVLGRPIGGDIDLTTDARPDRTTALVSGWADAVWDQGARFGTVGLKKGDTVFEVTTHRAEAYAPDSRKPDVTFADEVEADLAAARLHRQRDGVARHWRGRARPGADRPLRRGCRPGRGACSARRWRRRCPSPTIRCGCCARRGSSRATASRRTTRWSPPSASSSDGSTSCRPNGSATSSASCSSSRTRPPASGSSSRPGVADIVLPELPAMRVEQDPIHRHKDVLAHTIAVVAKTRPDARRADGGAAARRRQAQDALDRLARRVVPPPRGGRRPHGPRPAARASLPQRAGRRHQPARVPAPALPRLRRRRVDRQRRPPLRARRRRPARRAQRAHPLRLHHPQREAGADAGAPDGRARGAHRRAAGAGGAGRHPSRPRRRAGDGPPRASRRARRWGRRSPCCSRSDSTRDRSARKRPTAASTPGGPRAR